MATITSAQSGNFSSGSTWVGGAVPVDNDNFIIATGHTVTYDVTTPVTTGFNDSDIYGILQSQGGASTVLRMNGRLRVRTDGTYHARAGHTLQFRGSAASSHILYALNETGANLIMEGSDGMPFTTLTATAAENSTSLSFTSTTDFAPGEWIAVYNNTTSYGSNAGANTLTDEGFWIHDISGSTVYFRQFVGPESVIVSYSGSELTVQNSKVFRVGQKVIFGTGSNRNIHTITNINYFDHVLTLSGTITGTVDGLSIYETGSDKRHNLGDKVRKVATITTSAVTSTSTTIPVANASMFSAGDDIWVEARSEAGGSTDYWYENYGNETPGPRYKHTILSVSSNTITLTAAVGYNVVSGSLVNRLTRDVVVEPVTPNSDYYGIYILSGGTNYSRAVILKDVYFKYCGSNQGSAEGGIYIREGNWKANVSLPVTLTNTVPALSQQAWYEGVTMTGSNSTRDWGGFWIRGRYDQLRCCHVQGRFNSSYGLYYREGQCLYNSIAVGSDTWGPRCEACTEYGEIAYNYVSRCIRGGRLQQYDANLGVHHYITDSTEYSLHLVSNFYRAYYKHKHTGTLRGPQSDTGPSNVLVYSIHNYLSSADYTTYSRIRYQFHSGQVDRSHNGTWFSSIEHNMEYDSIYQASYLTQRIWDSSESAWRVYNIADGADYGCGWFESVFVPANTALIAKATVKLAPGFTGNYPRFEIRDVVSGVGPNIIAHSAYWSTFVSGGLTGTQFTAAAATDYESKELTITPVSYPRYLNIGVFADNSNQALGWWLKDIKVLLDKPYAVSRFSTMNSSPSAAALVGVGTSLAENKTRLNGRV